MASFINNITTKFSTEGTDQTVSSIDNVTKAQTRQANASTSAGRQFAAQSQGLGGIVAIYAGAAANIIAITSAFSALARAARNEEVIKGTENLASQIGASGSKIIQSLKQITEGQLSVVEAATVANTALSAGFSTKQLEGFTEVATKASKVLGRDLSDSISRLVKGSAKLEPELLDELGIFTRIEPAVQKYASSLNRAVSSLTEYERRQAFANAVIAEGNQKFNAIDVGGKTAQQSIEKLSASFADLTQKVAGFLANVAAPIADFFSKTGNLALVFGAVTAIVFSRLKDYIVNGLGAAFAFTTGKLDTFINKMQTAGPIAVEAFGKSSKEAMTALTGTGAIAGSDPKIARAEGAEIRRLLRDQDISIANAQKGSELTKRRMEDLKSLGQTGTAQFKGLELASAAFNERLQGTGGFVQGASKAVEGLRGGLDSVKGVISGVLGGLGKLVSVIAILQGVASLFGIDLLGAIGEQFSKFGEAAAKNREEVEKLTSAILTANGVTTQYANIVGATKEQQDSAAKAVADAAEQLTRGTVADVAANKSKAGLLEVLAAITLTTAANRPGAERLKTLTEDQDVAYKSLTKTIEILSAKGTKATAEDKLKLAGLQALKLETDDVGMSNLELLQTVKSTGVSYEAAVAAVKSLTTSTGKNSAANQEFRDILTVVRGKIVGFSKDNELLGKSYLSVSGAIEQFNDQLSKGANAEKLSQSLVSINTRLVELRTQYALTNKGESDLNSAQIKQYEEKARLLGDELSSLQMLEKINKDIQTTFASALTAADKLQISGSVDTKGVIATTPEQEKTNQLSYLQDLIKLSDGISQKEKEGLEYLKLKEENQRLGNLEGAKSLENKIKELGLDSKKLQLLRDAEAAQKVIVGLIIESAQASAKLLLEQQKVTLKSQNEVRVAQVQQELTILENELTILKSRQDIESKILDLTNQRVNAQNGLANAIAASKQAEVENAIKLIGLQQELLSIESRRAEAGQAASNAAANRKGQQELLAAERKQNELNIMGNLASEQQIRDADIAVARKKYEIEISRIGREENLVRTKASFDLKAIDLKEAQLKKEAELTDLKSIAAAKEGADQIILLNQKKEQDDLAYSNRVSQLTAEGAITDKNNQIAVLRADQARSERNFQLDVLNKQVALYELRAQIDNKLLEGLAANLEGEARLVALRQGENPDTARIKELANQLAESTKTQFQTNVEGLRRSVDDQKTASDSIYAIETRNAELTRTLKKTLGDEELAFLAKKQGISTQIYETEVAKIVETTAAKLNSLDADKKVIEGRIGGLNSERDIVRAQAAEKLTNLGIERDKAIEILSLAERKYQLESQGILKFMQLIKGAIDTNLNKGVDSFFDAIKNGTLTLKTFKEGVVGVFRDILFDIAKAATKELLIKPITDAITSALRTGVSALFDSKTADAIVGPVAKASAGAAGDLAKGAAGAATGQCGCITDALSKAGGVAEKAASAAVPAAAAKVAEGATPAIVKAASTDIVPKVVQTQTIIPDEATRTVLAGAKPPEVILDTSKPIEVTSVTAAGAPVDTSAFGNIGASGTIAGFQQYTMPNTDAFGMGTGGSTTFGSNMLNPTGSTGFGALGPMNGAYFNSNVPTAFNGTGYATNFGGGTPIGPGNPGSIAGAPGVTSFGMDAFQGPGFKSGMRADAGGGEGLNVENINASLDTTADKIEVLGTGTDSLNTNFTDFGGKILNAQSGVQNLANTTDSGVTSLTSLGQTSDLVNTAKLGEQVASTAETAATQLTTTQVAALGAASATSAAQIGGGGGTDIVGKLLAAPFGFGAAGGLIRATNSTMRRFAAGGGVMMRDRIPALLEPGEFVMKKSSVDSIGRNSLERMNATGKSSGGATNIKVQVENSGQPKEAQQGETQFDGETAIVKLILKDLSSNGPIRRSIRGNI